MSAPSAVGLTQALRTRWNGLALREQRMLWLAAWLVVCVGLWQFGLAPALTVLRSASAQQAQLDAQLQRMLAMQAQARSLQAIAQLDAQAQRKTLEGAIAPLGAAAALSGPAQRLTLTLRGLSAQALAQLLTSIRQNARLLPREAHLRRSDAQLWDGTLVFELADGGGG